MKPVHPEVGSSLGEFDSFSPVLQMEPKMGERKIYDFSVDAAEAVQHHAGLDPCSNI
jgi:hypothetical protein